MVLLTALFLGITFLNMFCLFFGLKTVSSSPKFDSLMSVFVYFYWVNFLKASLSVFHSHFSSWIIIFWYSVFIALPSCFSLFLQDLTLCSHFFFGYVVSYIYVFFSFRLNLIFVSSVFSVYSPIWKSFTFMSRSFCMKQNTQRTIKTNDIFSSLASLRIIIFYLSC